MSWENVGGRQTHYGALPADNKFGGDVHSAGALQELRLTFSYDDLPAVSAGNEMIASIPEGAAITEAYVKVLDAMTGTSGTLTIGTAEADGGGALDADGIDAAIAQAALTAGAVITCDGAQVGGAALADRAVITATTGGTVTGGRFELVVQYLA
jgi:hypothetical protein